MISTDAYAPWRNGCGGVKCTNLFCRVRPDSHRGVLLAGTLDEHLFDAPDPRLVLGQRAALDDDSQPLESLGSHGGFDEPIGHLGRLGARPRREDERVGVVVLRGSSDLERGGEVVVGLAREADDDVGRHGEVGDRSRARRRGVRGSAARCTRGASTPEPGRCPTATDSAGVRTRQASPPSPRTSRRACLWGAGW